MEGPSEIDLVLSGNGYLIFVEAKLDSDISLRTTYDPARNQILRNIDCLLEEAGDRTPRFWMLAKDRHSTRAYMQLLADYRRDPAAVHALLPHRAPDQIQTGAPLRLGSHLGRTGRPAPRPGSHSPEQAVLDEIRHRVE